jgi:phosphate transport system permease protein
MKPDRFMTPRLESNLPVRHRVGVVWRIVFQFSTIFGIMMLALLLITILNNVAGYVVIDSKVDPQSLEINGVELKEMSKNDLVTVLEENLSSGMIRQLTRNAPLTNLSEEELYNIIFDKVVKSEVLASWSLMDSVINRDEIQAEAAELYPDGELQWKTWFTLDFILSTASSDPLQAGVRTALLGSLWVILITIVVSLPTGVGAAIYLEEYAGDTWINRLIKTNITNLAGVPSIIYGMLGLAIFVRVLQPLTSGEIFGAVDPATANGRTILSAGLTLALLVLPLIIINAQEAIRAVPDLLRQASYGVGATRWQTIWHHVLPHAMPGVLTGAILAVSRAVGETAPLVVVGASTYINFDPSGVFSKFTILPIQIYQWTSRPQAEFRHLASAAILLLLIMLLSLNAAAIVLRNRYRPQL